MVSSLPNVPKFAALYLREAAEGLGLGLARHITGRYFLTQLARKLYDGDASRRMFIPVKKGETLW